MKTPPRTPQPWNDIFMTMARTIAQRSKDPNTQHGAIIADAKHRLVSCGFNGPPPQMVDATLNFGRQPAEGLPAKYAFICHAESNALWFAALDRGHTGLQGCTLYVTGPPCSKCLLEIVRSGITRVVYGDVLHSQMDTDWPLAQLIARLGNVELRAYQPTTEDQP